MGTDQVPLDSRLTWVTREKAPTGVQPVDSEGDPSFSGCGEVVTPNGRVVQPQFKDAEDYAYHMAGLDQPVHQDELYHR